jgi:uncharacterized membrane protein (DUF485 family)
MLKKRSNEYLDAKENIAYKEIVEKQRHLIRVSCLILIRIIYQLLILL